MEKKDKPRKLTSEQKIDKCELCLKENVVVTASGFYVAFVCDDCISR